MIDGDDMIRMLYATAAMNTLKNLLVQSAKAVEDAEAKMDELPGADSEYAKRCTEALDHYIHASIDLYEETFLVVTDGNYRVISEDGKEITFYSYEDPSEEGRDDSE